MKAEAATMSPNLGGFLRFYPSKTVKTGVESTPIANPDSDARAKESVAEGGRREGRGLG